MDFGFILFIVQNHSKVLNLEIPNKPLITYFKSFTYNSQKMLFENEEV